MIICRVHCNDFKTLQVSLYLRLWFLASISRLVRSADINLQKENGIQIDFYHAAKTNGLCSNTSMSSNDQSTDAYGMHGESRNVLHFLLDSSEQFQQITIRNGCVIVAKGGFVAVIKKKLRRIDFTRKTLCYLIIREGKLQKNFLKKLKLSQRKLRN